MLFIPRLQHHAVIPPFSFPPLLSVASDGGEGSECCEAKIEWGDSEEWGESSKMHILSFHRIFFCNCNKILLCILM